MKEWWAKTSEHLFEKHSLSHFSMMGLAAAGVALITTIKEKIARQLDKFKWLRVALLALLLASEVSYQAWTVSAGVWSFDGHMPLHLCAVASLAAVGALLTWNETMTQFAFFTGVVPPLIAVITPEVPYGYRHYRFWKFFLHHMSIPWAALFLAAAQPHAIHVRGALKVYGMLAAYALVIGKGINPLTGANYLYLSQRPNAKTPLDFLGTGKKYIVNLAIAGMGMFLGQLSVWKLLYWTPRKTGACAPVFFHSQKGSATDDLYCVPLKV
ncbi:TIGR02206 family membrane protein [Indiicoccus explosivorum]|uniref:YwaF family protein n=1 Tax=Indiicoccus explosivorum TaxID=1917864 RepID=UPI0013906107|nr:TIGR02206 family membrane protein [Indiicoccus explosivorum]